MPLHLITGPPNSGRTERLRELFVQAERKSPVLVVPSVGDIFAWERRLTEADGAFIGARVFHFRDLCVEIIRRSHEKRKLPVSEFRRRQMMAQTVREVWPDQATRLRTQPGFLDSLLELVDDFRTEEILNRDELLLRMEQAELPSLGKAVDVFGNYLETLTKSGGTDMPELISTAVRLLPGAWEAGSPLFMAGFDDFTGQQLEMVRRLLSGERGVDVTIAITHEPDNPGTAVSNELVAALREIGGAVGLTEEVFERTAQEADVSPVLYHVSRSFLRPTASPGDLLEVDDTITLIETAGVRNEAESIGSEIAGLLDSGVEPGAIGIAVTSPGVEGRLIREVLERFEVPVALEAEIPAGATIVGGSLKALLIALTSDSVDDLFFWLRSPIGESRDVVDRLEFLARRDSPGGAREIVSQLHQRGGKTPGWNDLARVLDSGESAIETLAGLTDGLADAILADAASRVPSQGVVLELKVAGAIRQALDELGELETDGQRQVEALLDALDNDAVKVWSSPSSDAVTIASPYGMRGKRFAHLFMAGLQESGTHDPERPGPFLSRENREFLGMSTKTDREDQERYLFYSCLTVPTERLWLCFTGSDETGRTTRPSPLVGVIEDMFEAPLNRVIRNGRTPVFPMNAAPTIAEVGRSAAAGMTIPEEIASSEAGSRITEEVAGARGAVERTATLRSLENPDLIEALAGDGTLSPTGLEAWAQCPYRWYVEKAVRPDRFGPESDYLRFGSVAHAALHRLYAGRTRSRPEQATLAAWMTDLEACLDEVLADPRFGLTDDGIRSAVLKLRIRRRLEDFLAIEAEHPRDDFLPLLFEHDFGPIEMDGPRPWKLAGKIDRIDVAGPDEGHEEGRTLVIDYKSGDVDKYQRAKALDKGLIQMILYLVAARSIEELEGAAPVGGLYLSLSGSKGRGGVEGDLKGRAGDWNLVWKEAEGDFQAWIQQGLELATESADQILRGAIEHDPAACRDHFEDIAVPDWSPAGASDEGEEEQD